MGAGFAGWFTNLRWKWRFCYRI